MADPLEGLSPSGVITTGADRARVDPVYEPLLSAAIMGVRAVGPNASLYLYGSVATGTAELPASDVDLLPIGLDPIRAAELADRLNDDYQHLCRAVEIAPTTDLDGDSDEAYGNRVFLRHYCVHLAGPKRHVGLPDYPADVRAARGFNGDIAQHLRHWRSAHTSGANAAAVGRRAARKTLLALTGIVSISDQTWTTDRNHAVARWSRLHPESAAGLKTLADWSNGDCVPNSRELANVLDGAVATIVDEFSRTIGLWEES